MRNLEKKIYSTKEARQFVRFEKKTNNSFLPYVVLDADYEYMSLSKSPAM